jgi:hypothetical protein
VAPQHKYLYQYRRYKMFYFFPKTVVEVIERSEQAVKVWSNMIPVEDHRNRVNDFITAYFSAASIIGKQCDNMVETLTNKPA